MKKIIVQWDADAYEHYQKLHQAVTHEKKNTKKPTSKQLLTSIHNAITRLKQNPFYGDLIPSIHITSKIINLYGTAKLFRIALVGYWRMLYTVVGTKTQLTVLILAYMDHPTYDKLFGYRKK